LQAELRTLATEVTDDRRAEAQARQLRASEHGAYAQSEGQLAGSIGALRATAAQGLNVTSAASKQLLAASVMAAMKGALQQDPEIRLSEQQRTALRAFLEISRTAERRLSEARAPAFLQMNLTSSQGQTLNLTSETREVSAALSQLADQQEVKHRRAMQREQEELKRFQALDQSLTKKIEVGQAALDLKQGRLTASQESLIEKARMLSHKKELAQATSAYMSSVVGQCRRRERALKEQASLRSVVFLSLSTVQRIIRSSGATSRSDVIAPRSIASVPVVSSVAIPTLSGDSADLFSLDSPASSFVQVQQIQNVDAKARMRATLQSMIVKLLDEASSEDGRATWCLDETGKSHKLEGEYSDAIKQLHGRIVQGEEEVPQIQNELANLRLQAQDLKQLNQRAASLHAAEHDQILREASEYQDSQALVQNAVTVLQGFSEAGSSQRGGASFLSRRPLLPEVGLPELSDQILRPRFLSQLQAPSGIAAGAVDDHARMLSLLNVAISGYAKLEAQGRLEVETAEQEYAKLLADTDTWTNMTATEEQYSQDAHDKAEHNLERTRSDLRGYESELAAVQRYLAQLKTSCGAGPSSPTAEDSAHREQLIQSLQTALKRLTVQV